MKGSHDDAKSNQHTLDRAGTRIWYFSVSQSIVIARTSTADDGKRKWEYGHLYSSYCKENNDCKASFKSASTPSIQAGNYQVSSYPPLILSSLLLEEESCLARPSKPDRDTFTAQAEAPVKFATRNSSLLRDRGTLRRSLRR